MKFWDITKISLKNMKNNKLRTVLVWFMLFIMCTIILTVLTVGIRTVDFFNANLNGSKMESQDLSIKCMPDERNVIDNFFTVPQIKRWQDVVWEKFPNLNIITMHCRGSIGNIDSKASSVVLTDTNYNMLHDRQDYLLDGRMWTGEDKNKPFVWVNKSYAESYKVKVGEIVPLKIEDENYGTYLYLEIAGIVDNVVPITDYYLPNIICDNVYMQNKGAKVTEINFVEPITGEGLNFSSWQKLKSFINKHNDYDEITKTGSVSVVSVATVYDFVFYIMIVVVFLAVIIALVVILLSIGAVANSIQITVEQNASFFGMMKAIGMRSSSLYNIVYIQSVLIIFAAVACACGVTFGILSAMSPWILSIFSSIGAVGLTINLAIPVWLPFVVFAVLVGMVILWTSKSLRAVDKKDVISMINEVGQ